VDDINYLGSFVAFARQHVNDRCGAADPALPNYSIVEHGHGILRV